MGSILFWLNSLWNDFTGDLSGIWHWIVSAFKAIWSFAYRIYNTLRSDMAYLAHDIALLARSIESWAATAVDNLYHLALKWVTDTQHWAATLIGKVASYAESVYRYAVHEISMLISAIEKAYSDIEHWVITQIWDPLLTFASQAVSWVEHEGAYIYDLITHPEKLVMLIGRYLLDSWLAWLRRYAVPVTRFILRSSMAIVPDLVAIAEDVLSKIL